MPSTIKKYTLRYSEVPRLFALDKEVYLSDEAELIPEEILDQTPAQKEYCAKTVDQIDTDAYRTRYVDFEGQKVSQLKARWLVTNQEGARALAKGVYPSYSQGNGTGACIGEIVYTMQFAMPLSIDNESSFQALHSDTKKLCFSYINDQGEPAGFSLLAAPHGDTNGQHQGWIISTIQNTTAHPKDRAVTVLASPEYTRSKSTLSVTMDNPETIEAELNAAVNNRKVVQLIKGIFNQDGSLNPNYLDELCSRIQTNLNIDDRDRKEAQLNTLMRWSETLDDLELNNTVSFLKAERTRDIHFFKEGTFELHLKKMVDALASTLQKQPGTTRTTKEITEILINITSRCADLEMLAEKAHKHLERANTYKALAQRIYLDAVSLRFDGTRDDETKITKLSLFDVSRVEKRVKEFYATDPAVQKYNEDKKQANQKMHDRIDQLPQPSKGSFIRRNAKTMAYGLASVLLIGLGIGLALTGILAPLSIALITVGAAALGSNVGMIIQSENKRPEAVKRFAQNVRKIREDHKSDRTDAEQMLQKRMNLPFFLAPIKPDFISRIKVDKTHPLTAGRVANALWQMGKDPEATAEAKDRFSFWATQQATLGFELKRLILSSMQTM